MSRRPAYSFRSAAELPFSRPPLGSSPAPAISPPATSETAGFLLARGTAAVRVVSMRASILLSLWLSASALPAAEKLDENLLNLFEARLQRDSSGLSIPYRLFKPRQYDLA